MIFPEAQETSGTPHAVGRFHLGRVGKNPADRAPVRILQYAMRDLAGSKCRLKRVVAVVAPLVGVPRCDRACP